MDYTRMWCYEHQHMIDLSESGSWTQGEYPCHSPADETEPEPQHELEASA